VPDGGVVWTDKAYPYGSTRGGTIRPHHGVEFNVGSSTPVFAAAGGIVIVAGDDLTTVFGVHTNFYGNLVVIQHNMLVNGQPVYTLYGHLSEVRVSVGQPVAAAEQIALSGGSGVADGPHLHFEVRVGQNSYESTRNPLLWLYPFPGRGVVAGRVTFPGSQPAYEAPVTLRRIDAPSPYSATTTYAQEQLNLNDGWQENFVLDDVTAGYYEVSVKNGDKTIKTEIWVFPNKTSFVEIVIGNHTLP
jgi:murein DD-endopeptidase MepM/ murein hydrolase activator NlpD